MACLVCLGSVFKALFILFFSILGATKIPKRSVSNECQYQACIMRKDGGAQGPKIAPLIFNMTPIFISSEIFEKFKKRYGITAEPLISENS